MTWTSLMLWNPSNEDALLHCHCHNPAREFYITLWRVIRFSVISFSLGARLMFWEMQLTPTLIELGCVYGKRMHNGTKKLVCVVNAYFITYLSKVCFPLHIPSLTNSKRFFTICTIFLKITIPKCFMLKFLGSDRLMFFFLSHVERDSLAQNWKLEIQFCEFFISLRKTNLYLCEQIDLLFEADLDTS